MPQEEPFVLRYWKMLLYLNPDQLRREQALQIILRCIVGAEQDLPPADGVSLRDPAHIDAPPSGSPGKQVNE